MPKDVSIILPVHNGARYLEKAVESISACLKNTGLSYEILIAEDGSSDGSISIARKLEAGSNCIKVLTSIERLGRGKAIKNAARAADSEKIIYMDVDMATDISCLRNFIAMLDANDLVIGSRYAAGSNSKRRLLRKFLSLSYISLANLASGRHVSDYQCGFKGFRKKVLLELCQEVKDNNWFWDTEIILTAVKRGKKLAEVPVAWIEANDSTVNLAKDTKNMLIALIKYRTDSK